MKDKLEEKLQYIKDAGYDLTDYETVDMLCSFIKESNSEAVDDFADYIFNWVETYGVGMDTILSHYYADKDMRLKKGEVTEYLSSIGKESEGKTWYFEGDDLVIKKGKWIIDRYKRHPKAYLSTIGKEQNERQ